MARNGSNLDYFQEALACIQHVHELTTGATGDRGELHPQQCRYLSSKVSETGGFLRAKTESLEDISSVDDIRRKALRHLHFTVKRAETLVRSCFGEFEPSWLEAAVTLTDIKEEIVDILLDLQWWTSMVGIAIASVMSVASGQNNELELVTAAEEDLERLMVQLLPPGVESANELGNAVATDKEELLKRVREVQSRYANIAHDHEYFLATHVCSRLEDVDVTQSKADVELNNYELGRVIGWGAYGAVMMVRWLGRNCAMKQLRNICPKEAMSLSPFHHPYIVQFFRYWEESSPLVTTDAALSSKIALHAPSQQRTTIVSKSHILMELLPLDLAAHMATGMPPEEQAPLSQDVAIDVMLQLAKAMWHMNSKYVVHRDLKPSNVLVQPVSCEVAPELAELGYVRMKLGDFGLAKTKVFSSAYSSQTVNKGTRFYGAPEVFNNEAFLGKRFPRKADVWSYGMMFSEVLSGRVPFENYLRGTLNDKIKDGSRPELPRACPDYLKFIIERCWKYKQEDRPSFRDLWKMVRFAQVRSLGIIRRDHQLFAFTTREGVVKQLHKRPHSGDYFQEALSCVQHVREFTSGATGSLHQLNQLHHHQCLYLSSKVSETGDFLREKREKLQEIADVDDIRRKALRHLHFTVKRVETLVRSCFCEFETSWVEAAVTLTNIKEDIVDILLDLQWWTSMVGIAIAAATWVSFGQKLELELVTTAEEDLEKLRAQLLPGGRAAIELDTAVSTDEAELLKRVREVQARYANKAHNLEYCLATHVRSRLEDIDVTQSMADVELNVHEPGDLLGWSSFSVVMMVRWLGRDCALKKLRYSCTKEATTLSAFHHPHIVQFFRYWEAPFLTTRGSSSQTDAASSSTSTLPAPEQVNFPSNSHILMEFLPLDLEKHMKALAEVRPRVGSKRASTVSESDGRAPLSEEVAIDVMLQLTKAMWHLNSKNVAHRDLKPNNCLMRRVSMQDAHELAERGYLRLKLGDFGLAKTKAQSVAFSTQTKTGAKIYAAPEVYNKDTISKKRFPRKADVWSYGIMFSEVLTGNRPFKGFAMGNLSNELKNGTRPELPRACPEYLKFIIQQCWKYKQEDRPNFLDLWKMVRFAQVRSLGLIRDDHQLFTFTTLEGVVQRLHKLPPPVKDLSKPSSFGLLRWCITPRRDLSNHEQLQSENSDPVGNHQRLHSKDRDPGSGWIMLFRPLTGAWRASHLKSHGSSMGRWDDKPLSNIVNEVGAPDAGESTSNSLDVIFFEGNVGERKFLSCKDTWVQRGRPNVWWPRDWLAKDFKGEIRVLVLQYDISEKGVEGVVDDLQRYLVFCDRWNRMDKWDRPIVLVGHSLGCVVIERLVVALYQKATLIDSVKDEFDGNRAKLAKAFLASLAGCFFYAPPCSGLFPHDGMLNYVFGGLTYSPKLFADLCLDSDEPQKLSQQFMLAKSERVQLMVLIEGWHTRGRTVVPPSSWQEFGGDVEELPDSDHSNTCKPVNKDHAAYRRLVEFLRAIQNEGNGP